MLKLKLFVVFLAIALANCEIQIPEKFKNAQPISAHPRYQEQLQKKFPKALNRNSEVNPCIVGGSLAARGQFPHHALIFSIYPNNLGRFYKQK